MRVRRREESRLRERGPGDLEADRQPRRGAKAGRDRDRRDARQRHRHREEVGEVHRERVLGALAALEGDGGRGGRDDEVALLERVAEVVAIFVRTRCAWP